MDTREIKSDGDEAATDVFRRASEAGIVFIPVTGISRTADVAAALNYRTHGIALRLTRAEFEKGGLEKQTKAFLREHKLTTEEIDLVVDLGAVDDLIADGIVTLTDAFLGEVPMHEKWRTFTISACAFPKSMGVVERDSHNFVERAEWVAWKSSLHARRNVLRRLPTFSDCAIQHPAGVEGFNPRTMQGSATIRYTLEDTWLLIKGKGTRTKRPGEQFPTLAAKLIYSNLKSYFAGSKHCDGCASMKAAADGAPRLGSLQVWRQLGTVHHITKVMQGLASLAWP